jgi:hypothetical protein
MNKYRGMEVEVGQMGQAAQKLLTERGNFLGGIVLNLSSLDLQLNQSPNSDAVFVEQGGLRADYGVDILGSSAATKVLALGQHKYVISGNETFERVFRIMRQVNTFILLESWSGTAWTAEYNSTFLALLDVPLSWVTLFDTLFIADGNNVLQWFQSTTIVAQSDVFAAGNITAVAGTKAATISPAIAYDQNYTIHFSIVIAGPCGANSSITLETLDNASSVIGTYTLSIPSSSDSARSQTYSHETMIANAIVANNDTMTIKYASKDVTATPRSVTLVATGGDPDWRVAKNPIAEAENDLYVFTFDLTYLGSPGSETPALLEFYMDTGSGFVSVATTNTSMEGINITQNVTLNGMGTGADFGMSIQSASHTLTNAIVTWDEEIASLIVTIDPSISASNGVTYYDQGAATNTLQEINKNPTPINLGTGTATTPFTTDQITDSGAFAAASVGNWIEITGGTGEGQIREITIKNSSNDVDVGPIWSTTLDATSTFEYYLPDKLVARYIWTLADRIIALQVDNDPQKIAWSIRGAKLGSVLDFSGIGSNEAIIRSQQKEEPVDDLMALPKMTSDVGALIRKRSIMRAVPTGQVEPAIAFYRWIEDLGTDSPFSAVSVPGGVLFLGYDHMVYYLTEGGALPVGQVIQDELRLNLGSNLDIIEGMYDPFAGTFTLAVPSKSGTSTSIGWILDFTRLKEHNEVVWQRHTRQIDRIVSVGGSDVYYATSDGDVSKINRDSLVSGSFWISPTLNRKSQFSEYTLSRVSVHYRSKDGATTIVIEGSGDGGVTFSAGNSASAVITQTTGGELQRVRMAFDNTRITGPDLRFKVIFPSAQKVVITGWEVEMIQRGNLEEE